MAFISLGRYRPDDRSTAYRDPLTWSLPAHATLKDLVRHFQYDIEYKNYLNFRPHWLTKSATIYESIATFTAGINCFRCSTQYNQKS
jgi:hypothetical protein